MSDTILKDCDFCLKKFDGSKVCECFLCKENRKRKFVLCDDCYKIHLDFHYKGSIYTPKLQLNDEDLNENSIRFKKELELMSNQYYGNDMGIF